jgi:GT2 family glycosyltransferase
VSELASNAVSVVVIGRNEGKRLTYCLRSVFTAEPGVAEVLYVDSASWDNSVQRAAVAGASVICLRGGRMTAARGRNAGWRAATSPFVLFVDGDCVLQPGFLQPALRLLKQDSSIAVVWGVLREEHPEASLYQRAMSLDWVYPEGDSDFCGGNALMRRSVLEATGGFDEELSAGEEPELCARIRAQGHRIVHIEAPMVLHDLGISSWKQYWNRAVRSGEAYAEVSRKLAERAGIRFWEAKTRRNYWQGGLYIALAIAALIASLWLWSPWPGAGVLAAWLALSIRTAWRARWKSDNPWTRLLYGVHSHFVYLPLLFGQARYHLRALKQVHS